MKTIEEYVEIDIELPAVIDVDVELAPTPEIIIEQDLIAEVDIDVSNVQVVTYYDLIFKEI